MTRIDERFGAAPPPEGRRAGPEHGNGDRGSTVRAGPGSLVPAAEVRL